MATFSGDTDGATTVGNTISERVDATSLMSASKTQSVVLSVNCDVLLVTTLKLLDSGLDVLHATRFAHLLTGEVAVKTSSVPVTWNWLGVEGDLGTKLLSDTVEEETGEPELITNCLNISRILRRRDAQYSRSIPSQGPTWNSHWAGITSALVPEILTPANKQAL